MRHQMRLFALLALGGLAACTDKASNPAPERLVEPLVIEERSSTVQMPVSFPLDALQREINAEVPILLHRIDEPQQTCIKTKSKLLPDISCRLVGTVQRGPIRLSGSGNVITLTMPVRTQVQAQNIGKIIKRETATGAIDLKARIVLGLRPDWQPTAKIDANYAWTNRIGIDFLGRRITFASKVDPELKKLLNQLERTLPGKLHKLGVKREVQSVWAKGFTSVRAKSDPQIWVRFTPERVGFSGYRIQGRRIVIGFAAGARTQTIFGERPADPPVTPLPHLMNTIPPGGVNVHVPVLVRYDVLQRAARKALLDKGKQTLELETGGRVDATFHDVRIYGTTGDRVAVGVDVSLKALAGAVNTKGTVWFVAKPAVDIPNRMVGVSDLVVAGQTDSKAFNMLLDAINQTQLRARLISALRYDFTRDYQEMERKADEWLEEQPFEGFVFRGDLVGIDLKGVRIAPDGLMVEADGRANAAMTFDPTRAKVLVAERRARRAAREAAKAEEAKAAVGK